MKFQVAIVGAGPAGYFTAQALQNAQDSNHTFQIDMLDRLPTPGGLVRSGVAPDKQKIKSIDGAFEKISKQAGFRFFGNVELGKDISLKALRDTYDAVVLAIGCPIGKKLGINGENLSNFISAAEFVPWYNSHPDYCNLEVNLDIETAVVIGNGNVALDVARVLAAEPKHFESTDISEYAQRKLQTSKIKKVIICGRRGPEHSSFALPELRELSRLDNVSFTFDKEQLSESISRVSNRNGIEKNVFDMLEMMNYINTRKKVNCRVDLEFKFLLTPLEAKGVNKVEKIDFFANKIEKNHFLNTDEKLSINTGLVISAIGYEVSNLNELQIKGGKIDNIAGHVDQNVYVTGWAKRGSVGVIGTNKSDAKDVVELLINNLRKPKNEKNIEDLIRRDHIIIDQLSWEKINATEIISGQIVGKPRIKLFDWEKLLVFGKLR